MTFPRVFEDILFGSSFAIIGHQSHIDHYDELPQTSTLQLLEIQTFEKLSQINWIAQMKSLTGKTSHVTFPETVEAKRKSPNGPNYNEKLPSAHNPPGPPQGPPPTTL